MSRFAAVKGSFLQEVSKRRMTIVVCVVLALAVMLGVAWYDGGRQEQRLIVEPVSLPGDNS